MEVRRGIRNDKIVRLNATCKQHRFGMAGNAILEINKNDKRKQRMLCWMQKRRPLDSKFLKIVVTAPKKNAASIDRSDCKWTIMMAHAMNQCVSVCHKTREEQELSTHVCCTSLAYLIESIELGKGRTEMIVSWSTSTNTDSKRKMKYWNWNWLFFVECKNWVRMHALDEIQHWAVMFWRRKNSTYC